MQKEYLKGCVLAARLCVSDMQGLMYTLITSSVEAAAEGRLPHQPLLSLTQRCHRSINVHNTGQGNKAAHTTKARRAPQA